ncbi:aldo/keto reductase [Sphingobacterium yanglingense]|uniref:Aryl-alcohol dehydrogenase-like predicted oxidoreductase n=1 Tax=Sphingobacterium yanglingense TaxID=1437280 RepID=A0A4V3DDK5_9SPHI|nr:aldo/keto reductase [Sphingobacterium yanglingense]TDQ77064.1 aryl-alcohol dehydrogenase-like predicted oxidoreductase [Sphingobacterium yanglingense]
MMDKRRLGSSSLDIVPLIFGGNVFGWTLDQHASFGILDAFIDLGFNAIDTANNYSHWVPGNKGGESETIIGNWLQERGLRDRVVLMTKVGGRFGYDSKPNVKGTYIKEEVENSLRRLRTDYIDLYQTHYDDEVTTVEETLRAYEDLIQEGKIRFIGASNISPERLVESLDTSAEKGLPSYVSLQPEYNLYDRAKFENLYEKISFEKQIAVIPYYSLASGFLTGKYSTEADFGQSARGAGIQEKYWNDRGRRIVAALNEVSHAYSVSASAVALAWLLAQRTVTAPIASATKNQHMNAFVEAVNLRLDAASLAKLELASS